MPTTTLPPIPTSRATPYLTLAELKRSPIYTQLQKLVPRGSQADNDAELVQIIKRVSALINGEVRQNLAATLDTESGWCRLTDEGDLRIHTRASPVIEVVSVTVGANPYTQVPITDLKYALTDPWRITISRQAMQNVGGIFGSGRCRRMWATWTYVNGYPVTTFAAPASLGDTSITVTDSIGIIAGQTVLTIEDGKYLEIITPTAVTGNVLTVEPLGFPHEVGVGILDLPYDIQEVALILISRLHNTWSLSMGAITHDGTGARKNPSAPGTGTRFLCDPGVILEPYKRVW